MQLEVTNDCNLRCKICMRTSRDVGYLKFEDFKILPLKDFREVAFHGWGEPLLHPQLFKMISYAKSLGLKTSLITNGTLIHKNIGNIFESGLDEVAFGIYTLEEKEKVVKNLESLINEKIMRGSKLKIFIDITIFSENINEIPEIVELGSDLGVDGVVLHRIFNLHDETIDYVSKDEESKLFKDVKKIKGVKVYIPKKHEIPCRIVKNCVYVTWDCLQSPCCFLCEFGYFLGRAFGNVIERHMRFVKEMDKNDVCRRCFW